MRFGIATCEIAPPFRTPMGGYGARKDPFDGINDPLEFSALILEEDGRRALIGAADFCNWPNDGSTERLIDQLADVLQTEPEQILLNASHTHGAPKIPGKGYLNRMRCDMASARRYVEWLFPRVIETVRKANEQLRQGSIDVIEGTSCLPMNRRRLVDGEIVNAPNPDGPVDDKLQILLIKDARNEPAVLVGRLSCHPVATGLQYLLTADFVGAWRRAVQEQLGPAIRPMFLQGAGGDMRPRAAANGDEWRKLRHDELPAVGRDLANETVAALRHGPSRRLGHLMLQGHVKIASAACELRYTTPEQVRPLLQHPRVFEREFAQACMEHFRNNETPASSVDFRVHTLWLDEHLAMVGLNCEPLHSVGQAIERAFAPNQAIVLGYTAGCICYTPDTTELQRGGYEAESYLFEPWSGPWRQGFERTFRPQLVTRPRARVAVAR